jgi:broad specificity phosphatase PhoE
MKRIFFMRHAQKAKGDNTYPGPGITPLGIKQAALVAKKFAKMLNASKYSIDHIYCSQMTRAIQTANIVNKELKLPISYHEHFREQNDMFWTDAKKFSKDTIRKRRLDNLTKQFTKIVKSKHETILIIGHGNAISIMMCLACGLPPRRSVKFTLAHTGLSLVKFEKTTEIVYSNKILLPPKIITWLNED